MRATLPVCPAPSAALGPGRAGGAHVAKRGNVSPPFPSRGAGLKLGLSFFSGVRGDQPD